MDLFNSETDPECIEERSKPLICRAGQDHPDLTGVRMVIDISIQRTEGFFEGFFNTPPDSHDLSGTFHRRGQGPVSILELVERPAGDLDDDVIDGRLKRCRGASGHRIDNLIELETDGDLCSNAGNGVSRGL